MKYTYSIREKVSPLSQRRHSHPANMLGIKRISPGRMGNRLFHYHCLRQIARKTGIGYFHPKFPEAVYFEEMGRKGKPLLHFRKTIEITSREMLSYEPAEFLRFVVEENKKGKNIVFSAPMLGEVFFDYVFCDPNEFIKVKEEFKAPLTLDSSEDKIVIGLHVRGTDFPVWNPNAALKFDYYEAAINYCLGYFGDKKVMFAVFTDDYAYPAYAQTVSFLKSIKHAQICFGDKDVWPIYDFYKMTQCDVLISSPSTFGIFAGVLGKRKKIIHSKEWVDYAVDRDDTFWVKLSETDNPYYSLWKTF